MTYTPSGSKVASLADRLQRPPRNTQPTPSSPEQPPAPSTGFPTIEAQQPPATRTPPADTPSQAQQPRESRHSGETVDKAGAPRQISFLLTPELRDRLRRQMTQANATMAEVILDAVESTHPTLDRLLADERPRARTGPLFTRTPKPTTADVKVQVNVRLPSAALDTLDRLVDDYEARNRTQLIAVALDHHLSHSATNESTRTGIANQ